MELHTQEKPLMTKVIKKQDCNDNYKLIYPFGQLGAIIVIKMCIYSTSTRTNSKLNMIYTTLKH